MLSLVLASAAFWAPAVRLADGQRVTLHGTGPPVVFSSGLFGLMPRRLYTELFRQLRDNVTLVVPEAVAPVTAATLADAADALAVDRVGFLSHSSIDAAILRSDRVHSAVLCDPVVLPEVSLMRGGLAPPPTNPPFPVRVLRAALAYEGDVKGIPEMISPQLEAASTRTFDDVGHADLLDDTWAEFGPRALPWMRGARTPAVPFAAWTREQRVRPAESRAAYRAAVATEILDHLLADGPAALPPTTTERAEDA